MARAAAPAGWALWVTLLVLTLVAPGYAQSDDPGRPGLEPFLWRNSGPLTAPFGLPRARAATLPAPRALSMDLVFERASHFTVAASAREAVLLDGETSTLVLRIERGIADGWAASAELVGMRHSGGFLDSAIDRWHGWFGLPEGGRDAAPRDRLLMTWDTDGSQRLLIDEAHAGVGDLRLGIARRLHRSPARDLALRLDVELPTGRASRLTGSGGIDVAAGMALTERRALERFGVIVHLGAGVLRPDGDDLVGHRLRSLAGYANWTLAWPVSDRFSIKGQLDGHTALVRSELRQVGGWSVQGGIGGAWQATPGVAVEVGVFEDLRPGSAPDVTFQFALRGRY